MSYLYDLNSYSHCDPLLQKQVNSDQNYTMQLRFILKLHSFLEVLKRPDIREDFLAGKIVVVQDSDSILASFEAMERLLFPDWLTPKQKLETDIESSIMHFKSLWDLSPLSFQLPESEKTLPLFNYGAWGEAIDAVFKSSYWHQTEQGVTDSAWDREDVQNEDLPTAEESFENSTFSENKTSHTNKSALPAENASSLQTLKKAKGHVNPALSGIPNVKKCTYCDYTSVHVHVVKTHIASVHMNLKPYECKECNKFFKHSKSLASHRTIVHEGLKPFKCKQCDSTFGRKGALRVHVASVHTLEKAHKCPECSYSCVSATYIKRHIDSIHRGVKQKDQAYPRSNHQCDICTYSSFSKTSLRSHIDGVHRGVKPFKCEHCDYAAASKSAVREHTKSVHDGIKRKNNYHCSECSLVTHSRRSLQIHVDGVHKGLKPYKCEDCSYATASPNMLRKHVAKVHYKCSECDFIATRETTVKRHMLAAHKQKRPPSVKQSKLKNILSRNRVKRKVTRRSDVISSLSQEEQDATITAVLDHESKIEPHSEDEDSSITLMNQHSTTEMVESKDNIAPTITNEEREAAANGENDNETLAITVEANAGNNVTIQFMTGDTFKATDKSRVDSIVSG